MSEDKPLKADGFDDAVIGTCCNTGRIVYSIERMLVILMERSDMSMEDAMEYFSFNIGCAYVGEMTPLYVWTEDKVEL